MKFRNKGKNYSIELPNVGSNAPIKYDHVNKLSEAIDKYKINSFLNGTVSTMNGGTSLAMKIKKERHPFKVTLIKDKVRLVVGNVNNSSNGYNPSGIFALNTNKMAPNGATCDYSLLPNHHQDPKYPLAVTFDRGEKTYDMVLFVQATSGSNAVFRYEKFSGQNSEIENFDPSTCVVIAMITKSNRVIQIRKSDVFIQPSHPFQINTVFDSIENVYNARIALGTVNNVIPTILGKSLTNSAAKLPLSTGDNYIWLSCYGEPKPKDFPTKVEIMMTESATPDALPSTNGNIMIGYVNITERDDGSGHMVKNAQTYQLVKNSLWAEAHRYEKSKVDYFFYHV